MGNMVFYGPYSAEYSNAIEINRRTIWTHHYQEPCAPLLLAFQNVNLSAESLFFNIMIIEPTLITCGMPNQ